MGKYIDKSDEPEYHQYESSLKSIEILVKKLKNQTDSIHTHDASKLNQSVQQIVDFMAKSAVIGQKFYSKSILILDNALVLNQNLFFQIELPDLFMENLSKFFIRISKYIQNNEQKINEERVENILYGSLYLILLLIYKAGSHHQNKNQLMLKVFTRAFITNLSNLPISHCSSKTIRVLSMILAFLIKKKHLRNEVKSITLEIISTCSDEVTRVYLVFIIKNIISDLKHFQIFKYKILDFLLTCLSAQETQVILNCLVSIYSLILHHRELIDSLIKKKFMKHWDAQIANFPTICLKILKILLPYFCVEKKQSWFNLYLDHVMLKKDQSCHVHVDIIEQLVKQLPGSVIVRYIEHNLLWEIENRMRDSRDQLLRKALGKFKQSLLIRLSEIDSNLVILYRSITERSLNLVLSDLN